MITYNITYNNVDLHVINNTMTIINKRVKKIRHYPGTNKSSKTDLGRKGTSISCDIVAYNDNEKLLMEQILSSDIVAELYINGEGRYYKNVVHEGEFEMSQGTRNGEIWTATANFIALDPVPYDIDTGQVMY
ncbi:MAG: hypothetical protein K9L56_15525 [Clostridiales bacterium]|nr:hypothetical protein [Clostridiales bacterium]